MSSAAAYAQPTKASHIGSRLRRNQAGCGFGQRALRRRLSAPEHAPGLPQAPASLGQPAASAAWVALAGHIGLGFDRASRQKHSRSSMLNSKTDMGPHPTAMPTPTAVSAEPTFIRREIASPCTHLARGHSMVRTASART